jgi:nicotinate-nucleotide adenylyltransferase
MSAGRGGRTRRVGIYGGTFNPVHTGHLILAESMREAFGLSRILFVPSGTPPHKSGRFPSGRSRLHMVRLAVEGNRRFGVLDTEVRRQGPSYTAETLRELQKQSPGRSEFFFLIGMDAFKEITTWHEAGSLTALAHFIIFPRPGHPLENPAPYMPPPLPGEPARHRRGILRSPVTGRNSIYLADAPLVDISSTDIRQRIAANRSCRYLLPEKVRAYISRRRLYR